MGMAFLEMSQSKVYADSRFFDVPCLLLRQFEKTFTPHNRKFQGEMAQNLLKLINFRKTRDAARNRGSILIGMIFLEMAYLQLYADSRIISLPCLLLCQFIKPCAPEIPKFLVKMDQNRRKIYFYSFWGTKRTPADSEMIFSAFLRH